MNNIILINDPNLNLLGKREQSQYGSITFDELKSKCLEHSKKIGVNIDFFQSNSEDGLIDRLHQAKKDSVDYVIINPGAFTHTSVALRDAFLGTNIPFIEVHISNIYSREDFRKKSFLSDISTGLITGLGTAGYEFALSSITRRG